MENNILLVGGGGHCKAVIDVIESTSKYKIIGIIDTIENIGKTVLGYLVIGSDEDLEKMRSLSLNAHVTVGSRGNSLLRKKIFNSLGKYGYKLPNIVSSHAYVSNHAQMGTGNLIMHGSIINANVNIGDNNILNSRSLVEHDSTIGSHNYISTGANINGMVTIRDNCYIGSGSVINQTLIIESNVIIGSGGVVVSDCHEEGVYIGIPAQRK